MTRKNADKKEHTLRDCVDLLIPFFGGDRTKVFTWLNAKNPLLGRIRPISMILAGRSNKLYDFIQSSLDENRS